LNGFGFLLPRDENQVHGYTGKDHEAAISWKEGNYGDFTLDAHMQSFEI
jgi:hypothetical protein